jgi:cytochrome P450
VQKLRNTLRYLPERWLDATPEMRAAFASFGTGSRTCLGINLASMELRHATACFFRDCANAQIATNMSDDAMAVQHYFLITPKGARCEITV